MPVSRPSFMATITVRVDENNIVVSDRLSKMNGGISTIFAPHASLLDSRLVSRTGVSRRVSPISCNVTENSHMEPNDASILVSNEFLGIDVRKVVGGVLQIYAGTISHQDYARGINELSFDRMVDPSSQLVQTEDKALFTGFFTRISAKGKGDRAVISIDAKDLTADLLKLKIPTSEMNNLPDGDLPLDQWIMQLIQRNPVIRGMIKSVIYDKKLKIPKAGDEAFVNPCRRTRKGKRRIIPRLFGVTSYWEQIVDVCVSVGWIPNISGTTIYLREARTFFGKESWMDTKFRRVIDGKETHIRRFVIGENTLEYSCDRDLTFSSVPVIKVVSSHYGEPIYAIYPEDHTPGKEKSVYTSTGDQRDRTVKIVPVGPVSGVEELERIAKYIWEHAARQEFSGEITTTYPFSYGGDNDSPDVMSIRVGDAIEIVSKRMTNSTLPGYTINAKEEDYSEQDKNSMMVTGIEMNTENIYRVSGVRHSFASGAYSCTINYHNWYSVMLDGKYNNLKPRSSTEVVSEVPPEGGAD